MLTEVLDMLMKLSPKVLKRKFKSVLRRITPRVCQPLMKGRGSGDRRFSR